MVSHHEHHTFFEFLADMFRHMFVGGLVLGLLWIMMLPVSMPISTVLWVLRAGRQGYWDIVLETNKALLALFFWGITAWLLYTLSTAWF